MTFTGFVVIPVNVRLYLPPPLFESVPSTAPLEVTEAVIVTVELLLVASRRSSRFDARYSARVIETVSEVGGGVAVG